jgi:orotidine-5'-phosphate decarboxylase
VEDSPENAAADQPAAQTFADRLVEAVERKRSQLVVGLDPRLDLLPLELRGEAQHSPEGIADAFSRFCRGIIDAVAPYAVCVKPQLAFFELYGSAGMRALEDVCAHAHDAGLLVIADAKRGDIGSTARAYAGAYLEPRGLHPPLADALTVNPYLGRDALEPFLLSCSRHRIPVAQTCRT